MTSNRKKVLDDKLCLVMWADHSQSYDIDPPFERALVLQTVGILYKENEEVVVLARDVDEQGIYFNFMTILKNNILYRRDLFFRK